MVKGRRKIYSDTVIEHAVHPRNLGEIQHADGYAKVVGSCEDTMEIWLKTRDDTIAKATFSTDGCGPSIASGSIITEMAAGKTIKEAYKISGNKVLEALGGLPEESRHCAVLAADTLKAAIKDYLALKREPWKKAYRNI